MAITSELLANNIVVAVSCGYLRHLSLATEYLMLLPSAFTVSYLVMFCQLTSAVIASRSRCVHWPHKVVCEYLSVAVQLQKFMAIAAGAWPMFTFLI